MSLGAWRAPQLCGRLLKEGAPPTSNQPWLVWLGMAGRPCPQGGQTEGSPPPPPLPAPCGRMSLASIPRPAPPPAPWAAAPAWAQAPHNLCPSPVPRSAHIRVRPSLILLRLLVRENNANGATARRPSSLYRARQEEGHRHSKRRHDGLPEALSGFGPRSTVHKGHATGKTEAGRELSSPPDPLRICAKHVHTGVPNAHLPRRAGGGTWYQEMYRVHAMPKCGHARQAGCDSGQLD